MSHRTNPDVTALLRSVNAMKADEVEREYGIDIEEDGTIYDRFDDVHYDSLLEWAEAQIGVQNEHIYGHQNWD